MNFMTSHNRLGSIKRFGQPWTPTEDALMRREYRKRGATGMKDILPNRSKGSICARARKLGLSRVWMLVERAIQETSIEELLGEDQSPLIKYTPDK